MPSSSKAQQKFMGLVHAYKKGEVKGSEVSNAIKKAAKSMKKKSAKDYASTEHNGLPKKVKEEGFGGQLKGKDKLKFEKARKANGEQLGYTLSDTPDIKEGKFSSVPTKKLVKTYKQMADERLSGSSALTFRLIAKELIKRKAKLETVDEDRDYKEEYKKYGSSTKSKKYRAELNQYNRKKGTYGNGDGKDASHKGGKIVGFEKESTNRGRAEKSRLKKESSSAYGKSIEKIANDRKLKSISKKDRGLLLKIAKLMKKANESVNEARSTNREWTKFEKAFGDFYTTVIKLGKANTKLTGDKTDEKIFLINFTRNVGKFYSLMQSWVRGQNESVTESDLGLTYKKGKTVKVTHKSSGKRLVIVDKPNVRKEYEKIGYFAEAKTKSIDGKALYDFLQKRFKMSKSKAIATMKKHKMDMSFLKKESVNESIQLPHSMKLGKVFTGHGKSFVKEESVNEDVGVETILGGIVQSIQKAGLKPKSAKLMKSGFKVSKRDKVGFVIDVEIRGFDKKEIHKMQFEVESGMLYLILNNKPVKLGKWTMGTMVTKNLKKVALTLSGQKGSPKRIA
jgi:hypothetical protein